MPTKLSRIHLDEQQHLVLHGVSWDLYKQLLREIADRPIRMTFDNGSLEIMSPLPRHEKWKKRIGRMIELMAFELNLSIEPLGSTTFKRRKIGKGLEPDECYYIQHAETMRGRDRFNLAVDPPPDLALEVDITSRSLKREPIYRALQVPELWRFRAHRLSILLLGAEKTYTQSASSAAFPFLPMATFEAFLLRMEHEDQHAVLLEFRSWIRTLNP